MSHLSEKQISQILSGAVRGAEMRDSLLHVEECADCRARVPVLGKSQLLSLISDDPVLMPTSGRVDKYPPASIWGWNPRILQIGFAGVLALLLGGFLIWFFNSREPQIVVTPNTTNTPEPVKQPEANSNSVEEKVLIANTNDNQNSNIIVKQVPLNTSEQNSTDTPELPKQPQIEDSLDRKELALNLKKVPQSIRDLESPDVNLRGNDPDKNKSFPRYPVGEVIRETQPVLRWDQIKKAESYRVVIYDENYNELYSQEIKGTVWKVEKPLERGKKYQWQVKASIKENVVTLPPSIFRVAGDKTIGELDKAKIGNSSQWKQANVLFNEGLLSETEKVLGDILRKNPKDKAALQFLQRVRSLKKKNQNPPSETKPAQ